MAGLEPAIQNTAVNAVKPDGRVKHRHDMKSDGVATQC